MVYIYIGNMIAVLVFNTHQRLVITRECCGMPCSWFSQKHGLPAFMEHSLAIAC